MCYIHTRMYTYIHIKKIYICTSTFFSWYTPLPLSFFLYFPCIVCALEHTLYSVRAPGVYLFFLMYMPAKIAYISLIFH